MKNLLLSLLIVAVLFGCEEVTEQDCWNTMYEYTPVYADLSEIRSIHFEAPREINNPGKIYVYQNYLFVNEVNEGIHVIDNSNQTNPQPVGFYSIKGNHDLAIKNDILYADNYIDLLSIDISTIESPEIKDIEEHVYSTPFSYDSTFQELIVDYTVKQVELVDCNNARFFNSSTAVAEFSSGGYSTDANLVGQAGSTARFTITDNYLYLIDQLNIHSFDLSNEIDPEQTSTTEVGWNIETIFPYNNNLFIGASDGMHILSIENPAQPTYASTFNHFEGCDPVIVDEDIAYVTIRGGSVCGNRGNQLLKIDVDDIYEPELLFEMNMTNPHGLGMFNDHLFICDGEDGIKVYNKTRLTADAYQDSQISTVESVFGKDIILLSNNTAIVLTDEGFEQYDVSDLNSISKLSTIQVY